MSSKSNLNKKERRKKYSDKQSKKEAYRSFLKHFLPLLFAVLLWLITNAVLHLPSIRPAVEDFFVRFTLESAVKFGKLLFIPVESPAFPKITVAGYTMQVIMECTAYTFYIFVFYLSILSPVKWYQRLITLIVFMLSVFVVNNFRFYTMGFIGKYYVDIFHQVHDYFWNILFGFLVFLIWMWRYRSVKI